MRNQAFFALSLVALVLCGMHTSHAGFELTFDENGNGKLILGDGTSHVATGFGQLDPDYHTFALTYALPDLVTSGTVGVLEPSGGLTDAMNFYTINGQSFMSFFSDGGDHDLADSLSRGFLPPLGNFNVKENAIGIFDWFPGTNSYHGFSGGDIVPEPSTFVLLGLGGIGLAVGAYRRRRAAAV